MKTNRMWASAPMAALLVAAGITLTPATGAAWPLWRHGRAEPQPATSAPDTNARRLPPGFRQDYVERDLSGPRLGFTAALGDGAVYRTLRENDMGRLVSQFGWQFEHQVVPLGRGPQLITEAIPLVGAVEYGKFIPSLTLALGARSRSGYEIGMGPSFTAVNAAGGSSVGLVFAVGKTLDYSGVCLPINFAVATHPKGTRFTLLAGYSIPRVAR